MGSSGSRADFPSEGVVTPVASGQFMKSLPLAAAAGLSGVLVAGALALWATYGSAVFFEMIAAGFRACF